MNRPEAYVRDWLALLEYTKGTVDQKIFKQKHDILAAFYKKMDWAEQGEVSHILDQMKYASL